MNKINNKNVYETIFIITPVLSEIQYYDIIKEYEIFLKKNNVEIRHKEFWGLKSLSYSIQNKQNGWYFLIEYHSKPELIFNFELKLKNDERIIRFLTVKLNKHAINYVQKKRQKK
ncbi:30S ribosomal protein S6 [Candidatus Shikimatogenerans silvanidophilus]|uniref:30S ribosomal protein S6 n=1 Tax=Candidatus Shikimatogenerans silvanidophilus TaxID=2782547 RepID=UPI001BACAC48|nr:30S ribosomal protein S6 [Candidatus Shikimatogenerans silvanidophilus]